MFSAVIFIFLLVFSFSSAASIQHNNSSKVHPFYDGEVLFIGASITQYWKAEGLSVWNQYYAPLGAVNVGVAGDTTQQTIDRLNSGYVDNLNARVVVLNIGNNDISQGKDIDYIKVQIGRILGLLQSKFNNVKVILLQILPRGGESLHQKARDTNAIIRTYDDGFRVRYLDMENKFCTGLGQIITSLYQSDWVHLTVNGYKVWQAEMASLFNEVLYG